MIHVHIRTKLIDKNGLIYDISHAWPPPSYVDTTVPNAAQTHFGWTWTNLICSATVKENPISWRWWSTRLVGNLPLGNATKKLLNAFRSTRLGTLVTRPTAFSIELYHCLRCISSNHSCAHLPSRGSFSFFVCLFVSWSASWFLPRFLKIYLKSAVYDQDDQRNTSTSKVLQVQLSISNNNSKHQRPTQLLQSQGRLSLRPRPPPAMARRKL